MWFSKRTPKPSETALLVETITKLTAELLAQSQDNRQTDKALLEMLKERDAQIRLVLEAKFEQRVVMYPPKTEAAPEPADTEHLQDVSEMSESEATRQVEKSTQGYKQATVDLEESLRELAEEHQAAHAGEPPA